jgi:flavin-dependent dehydrogenase
VDVELSGDSVTATVAGPDGGEPSRLRARAIVDASGRAGILARRFGLRIEEPDLANVAVFSHYAGVPRAGGRRAGDIRIVARRDLGWFWMIPISEDLMSVGAVLPQAAFKPLSHIGPEELLARLIAETPAVARLMTNAERKWAVRVERDFSYGARAYAGDRWIAVGDAGSFLDPVFSTGVAIAMESGLEGARAIDDGLARGTLRRSAFRTFERRQRERYLSFRRFVRGFYTREFRDLFFSPSPPARIFRSVITVFAGYWRPSLVTRVWVVLFFLSVRLQARLGFAPSHLRIEDGGDGVRGDGGDGGHGSKGRNGESEETETRMFS